MGISFEKGRNTVEWQLPGEPTKEKIAYTHTHTHTNAGFVNNRRLVTDGRFRRSYDLCLYMDGCCIKKEKKTALARRKMARPPAHVYY